MDKGDVLGRALAAALSGDARGEARAAAVVAVACSGGRDSMALLDVAARWASDRSVRVVALHVHHGLSAGADDWEAHVARWCSERAARGGDVGFRSKRVQLVPKKGASLEAQARDARYAALAELARAVDAGCVLLAHHLDDQAETFLLQALRGAGPRGLSAMPARRQALGVTWLRPWLGCERALIEAHVHGRGIAYVEDDSNTSLRFARNRLRHEVLPLLERASPGAARMLARSAGLVQEAAACQSQRAWDDLERVRDPCGGLDVARLDELTGAQRRAVLHCWLSRDLGVAAHHQDIVRLDAEVGGARSVGRWPWPLGGELRQYRGRLFWCEPASLVEAASPDSRTIADVRSAQRVVCDPGEGLHVPEGGGWVWIRPPIPGEQALAAPHWEGLEWRRRRGGETFQFAPRSIPRSLRKQFQSRGIPDGLRPEWLLWDGDALLFVPGLGVDARSWVSRSDPECRSLVWQPPHGA